MFIQLAKFLYSNMKFLLPKKNTFTQGFTLIELLVALGVFSVVMTIALGSVISILDAGRKSKSLTSIMTNLNFTMEIMSREIKFGKNYYCGTDKSIPHISTMDCTATAGTSFTFTTSEGVDTIYNFNNATHQIEKSIDHGTTYIGLTSQDIVIQNLKYYVFDSTPASSGNFNQPRVLVYIQGYAGSKPNSQSSFTLQTLISQRALDF